MGKRDVFHKTGSRPIITYCSTAKGATGNVHRKYVEFGRVVPEICVFTDEKGWDARHNTLLPYYQAK